MRNCCYFGLLERFILNSDFICFLLFFMIFREREEKKWIKIYMKVIEIKLRIWFIYYKDLGFVEKVEEELVILISRWRKVYKLNERE